MDSEVIRMEEMPPATQSAIFQHQLIQSKLTGMNSNLD